MNRIIKEDIQNICKEKLPWNKLKNKRILITGANGYLASYIVYTLLYRNEKYNDNIIVYALCRNKEKSKKHFSEYLNRKDFELIFQNVCDYIDDSYESDIIIHAASPANSYALETNLENILDSNIRGFSNILFSAQKWKTKEVLLFSSGTVYGEKTPIDGASEEYRGAIDFTAKANCYRLCKQMCEMMSEVYYIDYDMNIKTVRPFIIYGPGMVYSQHKHITDFLKNYIFEENILLKSNGNGIRSFCYIADATKAFLYVLLKGEKNMAYNVSSMKGISSIKELAKVFTNFNSALSIEYEESIEKESYLKEKSKILIGKNNKLKNLGWKDETTLDEGIWRTICWAKESDFLDN